MVGGGVFEEEANLSWCKNAISEDIVSHSCSDDGLEDFVEKAKDTDGPVG